MKKHLKPPDFKIMLNKYKIYALEQKRKREDNHSNNNNKTARTITNAPTIKPNINKIPIVDIPKINVKVSDTPPKTIKKKNVVSTDPVWELASTTDGPDVVMLGDPPTLESKQEKEKHNATNKKVSFPNNNTNEIQSRIFETFSKKNDNKSRSDLAPIKAMEEHANRTPFNMAKFLDTIPLTGLTFLDLVQLSATARRKLNDCLKLLPKADHRVLLAKNPMLQQLQLDDDKSYQKIVKDHPEVNTEDHFKIYMTKYSKINTPNSSTHALECTLNNKKVVADLDSGCCLIAIQEDWLNKKNIKKTYDTSRFGLRAAQGDAAQVTGEVHDIICEFGNIRCVFGAVVVKDLDCCVLLGRPFLELLRTVTLWESSIYLVTYDYQWAIINGVSGKVLSQKTLTEKEDQDWKQGILPKHSVKLDIPSKTAAINTAMQNEKLSKIDDSESDNDISHYQDNSDDDEEIDIHMLHNRLFKAYPNVEIISQDEMDLEINNKATINVLSIKDCDNIQSQKYQKLFSEKADEIQKFFKTIDNLQKNTDDPSYRINALKIIDVPALEKIKEKEENVYDVSVMPIRIVTLNCNSIRNFKKKAYSELEMLFANYDVICLQEVRINLQQLDTFDLSFSEGFTCFWSTCETTKGYSSVATFIRQNITNVKEKTICTLPGFNDEEMEGRYIEVHLNNNVVVLNSYFPNGRMSSRREYKMKYHQAFQQRYKELITKGYIVIICCDLNIAHTVDDIHPFAIKMIKDNSGFNDNERQWIDDFINNGAIDIWRNKNKEPNKFTTWLGINNARSKNFGMRFDYIFISVSSSIEIVESTMLDNFYGSDHIPVSAVINIWLEDINHKIYSLYSPTCVGDTNNASKSDFKIDDIPEAEFLKKLNIVCENGEYFKQVGNVKVLIRPRKGVTKTETEDFVVDDFVFQIAKDAPEHAKDLMRKTLENRKCFVNKGVPGRTMTNVPMVELEHKPPEKYKYPFVRSKSWKPHEEKYLEPWTEKMEKHKKIELAVPPVRTVSVPVLSIKEDKTKVCFNYKINEHLVPMVYPITPVREVLQFIALSVLLSGYDHASAYEQNPLHPLSRWLTTILLPKGLYQFCVTPIGLKVSGEWFSYTLENVVMKSDENFKLPNELPLETFVKSYRDDTTQKQTNLDYGFHARIADRLLTCMDHHTGSFSAHKVFLLVERWVILGYLVGKGELIPTVEKVDTLLQWKFPKNQSELLSFLGFVIFLNHCIHSPQESIQILTKLQKGIYKNVNLYQKEVESNTAQYYRAFYTLKRLMSYRFALTVCDPKRPCILITDADQTSTGGIAAHPVNVEDDTNITATTLYSPWHIQTRKFTDIELKKLSNPEKELCGAVHLMKKVQNQIGSEVYIIMDHIAWVIVRNRENVQSKRAQKFLTYLDSCSIKNGFPKFIFRKGKEHTDVDVLSRSNLGTYDEDGTFDIEDFVDEQIGSGPNINVSIKLLQIGWEPYDSITKYLQGRQLNLPDDLYRKIVRKARDYFIMDRDLYRRPNVGIYDARRVPKYRELHNILLENHINHGHANPIVMFATIAPRYFWDGMNNDILMFYNGCQICQQRRRHRATKYKLYRILPPRTTMIWIGIDVLYLPGSCGKEGLLNVIDYTTSWANSYPVKRSATTRTFTNCLDNWISIFGAPIRIFMDNASTFVSDEFKQWAARHGCELEIPSVGHSMGNAKIESYNYVITLILAKILLEHNEKPNRWMIYLQRALRIYRVRYQRNAGLSPYQALFRQDFQPPMGFDDNDLSFDLNELEELVNNHFDFIQTLNPQINNYRNVMHNAFIAENVKLKDPIEYKPNDIVWLYNKKADTSLATERKLDVIWKGPYQIQESLGNGAYVLYDMIHERLLPGTRNHIHLSKWNPPTNSLSYSRNRGNIFKMVATFDYDQVVRTIDDVLDVSFCEKENIQKRCGNFTTIFYVEWENFTDFYGIKHKEQTHTLILVPLSKLVTALNYLLKTNNIETCVYTFVIPEFIIQENENLVDVLLTQSIKGSPALLIHDGNTFDTRTCAIWQDTFVWTLKGNKNLGDIPHLGEPFACCDTYLNFMGNPNELLTDAGKRMRDNRVSCPLSQESG